METVTKKLALVCVLYHSPPNAMRLQTGPEDTCQKAIPPLLQEGNVAWPWVVEIREGMTKETGHLRGPRIDNQDNSTSILRSQVEGPHRPLSEPSRFCASTLPPLPSTATQKWPPWFSHYIANMQSFLWFKKKKVIISRSNMQID